LITNQLLYQLSYKGISLSLASFKLKADVYQ
jgi:hypothetical protein